MDKIDPFSLPELPTRWQLLQMPLPPTLYHMIYMYWLAKVVENSSHVNHFLHKAQTLTQFTIESLGVSQNQIVGYFCVRHNSYFHFPIFFVSANKSFISFKLKTSLFWAWKSIGALEWAHTDDSIIVKCCKYTGLTCTLHHLRVKAAIWKKSVWQ